MAQTEDDPYLVSAVVEDFAVDDAAALDEVDDDTSDLAETSVVVNQSIIDEIQEYCKTAIAEYNSFDVITLPTNAKPEEKMAVYDEMFRYKGLVHHLRQIQTIIDNKVKEKI